MIKKRAYGIAILIFSGSLTACSGGPKGQLLSAIKKDKTAVITDSLTLTFPKNGTDDLVDFMKKSKVDQYIADNYLLLEKEPPPQGSILQKMEADGYVTKKRYLVTTDFQGNHSFSEEAGGGSKGVFVYFLTKNGKKYVSKNHSALDALNAVSNYVVNVKFYKQIPDHVVDYSLPSGNSGQSSVTANVDFRVAKAVPDDIFGLLNEMQEKSGGKVPKIGSYIKHECEFTKMSDGYEFNGCSV